jgi:pSer/pThr/pTyr-binding forkhead associated (FHA) protein
MKVVLELQDQPANVRRVMVRHDIVIGRGSDCNLRLSAPQVSRRHCFLRVGRDAVSVTDLDSSNGTYVNGQRIKSGKRYDLTNGSTLGIGPVRFLIHVREEVVSADILKSGNLNQAIRASSGRSSDKSTIVENSSAFIVDDQGLMSRPLDLSVEQAGQAAEANEATADFRNGSDDQENQPRRTGVAAEEDAMDSRAEIIDLGRRMAALDDLPTENSSRASETESQTAIDKNSAQPDLAEAEFSEYDLPQTADLSTVEEVLDVEEVEEILDVQVEQESDPQVVEDATKLPEDSDVSWFNAAPDDEDDIDPNLKDFLKGF